MPSGVWRFREPADALHLQGLAVLRDGEPALPATVAVMCPDRGAWRIALAVSWSPEPPVQRRHPRMIQGRAPSLEYQPPRSSDGSVLASRGAPSTRSGGASSLDQPPILREAAQRASPGSRGPCTCRSHDRGRGRWLRRGGGGERVIETAVTPSAPTHMRQRVGRSASKASTARVAAGSTESVSYVSTRAPSATSPQRTAHDATRTPSISTRHAPHVSSRQAREAERTPSLRFEGRRAACARRRPRGSRPRLRGVACAGSSRGSGQRSEIKPRTTSRSRRSPSRSGC